VDHLFVFDGHGRIRDVQGNFTDYRSSNKGKKAVVHTSVVKVESTKTKQPQKKLSYNEKQEFEGLESEIAELEKVKDRLNEKLTQPNTDYTQLAEWGKELEELKATITTKEDRWLELSELL
jgi:ATP-binding cassette subfamily F protein uup